MALLPTSDGTVDPERIASPFDGGFVALVKGHKEILEGSIPGAGTGTGEGIRAVGGVRDCTA